MRRGCTLVAPTPPEAQLWRGYSRDPPIHCRIRGQVQWWLEYCCAAPSPAGGASSQMSASTPSHHDRCRRIERLLTTEEWEILDRLCAAFHLSEWIEWRDAGAWLRQTVENMVCFRLFHELHEAGGVPWWTAWRQVESQTGITAETLSARYQNHRKRAA